MRVPAGWLIDRTRRPEAYAIGGVLLASALTALVPHADRFGSLLVLVGSFGAVSGVAFVAIGVGLTAASTPATRGLVMGGYSTSLYAGLALGSFGFGPVVAHAGFGVAFAAAAVVAAAGAVIAACLQSTGRLEPEAP